MDDEFMRWWCEVGIRRFSGYTDGELVSICGVMEQCWLAAREGDIGPGDQVTAPVLMHPRDAYLDLATGRRPDVLTSARPRVIGRLVLLRDSMPGHPYWNLWPVFKLVQGQAPQLIELYPMNRPAGRDEWRAKKS